MKTLFILLCLLLISCAKTSVTPDCKPAQEDLETLCSQERYRREKRGYYAEKTPEYDFWTLRIDSTLQRQSEFIKYADSLGCTLIPCK